MRLLPIGACQPGMKLAKNIYDEDGRVLLGQDVELTATILARLNRYGIGFLYIRDPLTEDVHVQDLLSDETRVRASQTIRTQFSRLMGETLKSTTVSRPDLGSVFRRLLDLIIDDLSRNENAMSMVCDIQLADNYLYRHSLNVCTYSTMLGMMKGYTRDELSTLGLGALLHDIGKTKIRRSTLLKPGELSEEEFEEMKRHAKLGYDLLRVEPNIPLLAAHCAFQHHERLDGSGYPRGLKGAEIHEYARLVALIDSYDAMTSHRIYRQAMLPHQAMEILYGGAGGIYDKSMIELFRDKIAIYPIGVEVTLNTGESGVVVELNAHVPHRPVIRLFKDSEGVPYAAPRELDLSQTLTALISSVGHSRAEQTV